MTIQEEYARLQQQINDCDHKGDYVGLAGYMERYLQLTGEIYGVESPQYGTVLNDYGGIHRDIGNYDKAEQAFLQSAQLIGRLQGVGHPDYASVQNNLAGLYRLMGQLEKAEQHFQQALQIYEQTVGKEHFLYISGMNNLGLVYQDMKRFAEAEVLHVRSLEALEQAGDNPVAIATTLTNLASARRQQGKLSEVQPLLEQALRMYEAQLGREHSLYAYGLNNLASYYMQIGEYGKAKIYYQSAMEICKVLFGVGSRNYEVSLRNYELASQRAAEQRGMQ